MSLSATSLSNRSDSVRQTLILFRGWFVYLVGLAILYWSLFHADGAIARVGNRLPLALLGLALCLGGSLAAWNFVSRLSWPLLQIGIVMTALTGLFANLIIGPEHLDRQRYKIKSVATPTLAAMSKNSPNRTIANARHPYFAIRQQFRNRHIVLTPGAPVNASTLISMSAMRTVRTVELDETARQQLISSMADSDIASTVLMDNGARLTLVSGPAQTVYVISDSEDETGSSWLFVPADLDTDKAGN